MHGIMMLTVVVRERGAVKEGEMKLLIFVAFVRSLAPTLVGERKEARVRHDCEAKPRSTGA
jgi:hypothetical protein